MMTKQLYIPVTDGDGHTYLVKTVEERQRFYEIMDQDYDDLSTEDENWIDDLPRLEDQDYRIVLLDE